MLKFLKAVAAFGGLMAFAVFIGMALSWLLPATTLTLTDHVNTATGAQVMATINANYAALRNVINGNLTKDNLKPSMQAADKITKAYLDLTGAIVQADLDPNVLFITANATTGIVAGYGPLRAHAQTSPDLTLKVEAGAYKIGESTFVYGGGNSPTLTRPTASPRISVLALDPNGAFSNGNTTAVWIYGGESATAAPPVIPPGLAPVAYVYSRTAAAGCASIKDTDDGSSCYAWREARPESIGREIIHFRDDFNWWFTGADWPMWWALRDSECTVSTTSRTVECATGATADAGFGNGSHTDAVNEPMFGNVFRLDRGGQIRLRVRLKVDDASDTGFAFGLTQDDPDGTAVVSWDNFAGLRNAGGTALNCEAEKAGVKTTSAGPTIVVGTWQTYELLISSTSLKVWQDGILSSCTVATNLPDTVQIWFGIRGETGGGGAQNYDVDYVEIADVAPALAS
jgi:hypothetical protein